MVAKVSIIYTKVLVILVIIAQYGNQINAQDYEDYDRCQYASNLSCIEYNSHQVCSGRGHCVCGQCVCYERLNPNEIVSGQYCECDNFSCPKFDGQICSGSDHGSCQCGICVCQSEWENDDCHCSNSVNNCFNPYDTSEDNQACSGNGYCQCNHCKCFESPNPSVQYGGPYCELGVYNSGNQVIVFWSLSLMYLICSSLDNMLLP